jgi:hypothetical protein
MAVVKASFTKSRGGAKASLHYILFRPGKGGEKVARQLFGHDGSMSIFQAEKLIDEAGKGTTFFRIVISPDPEKEDTYKDLNLEELTQLTILKLEDRLKQQIHFFATEHNDHTPNRHIHLIALIPGKLGVKELALLRQTATDIALFQRQERDLAQAHAHMQGRGVGVPLGVPVSVRPNARTPEAKRQVYEPSIRGGSGAKPKPDYQVCHLCGKIAGKKAIRCYNCGARLAISLDLRDNVLENDWDL